MPQPINPLTTLTTSLQVDKIEQIKKMANMMEQGVVGQSQQIDNARQQKKVTLKQQLEEGRFGQGHQENFKEQENTDSKSEDENTEDLKKQKGNVIDVKI